jgi:hypothetical protein
MFVSLWITFYIQLQTQDLKCVLAGEDPERRPGLQREAAVSSSVVVTLLSHKQ